MKNIKLIFLTLIVFCWESAYSQAFTPVKCGENSSATGSLAVGQTVSMNGSTDLSGCMVGNDGAFIKTIQLTEPGTPGYSYKVVVQGDGPSGWGSGSFYLRFIDETNDYYDLSLYLSDFESHEVSFNSDNPTIKTILWSDTSFPFNYFCSDCISLVQETLSELLDEASGCSDLSEEFAAECDALAGGPEDVVGDLVCVAGAYAVDQVCNQITFNQLINNLPAASRQICAAINLCGQ